MLNAQQVNTILDAVLGTFETRVVTPVPLSIGPPEIAKQSSAYGSVILGALFTGGLDGKLTLTLEWTTAFQMAEALTQTPIDGFSELVQRALEGVFYEAGQAIASKFAEKGTAIEIHPLPTLIDTSVLLAEEHVPCTLKLPIQGDSGVIQLFLAFK